MFAAANGHSIQLYRTYTAEYIALLRRHNEGAFFALDTARY